MEKLRLPPYGKPLHDLIKSGKRPQNSVNVFIGGKAWEKGESFSISYPERTLIIPPWCDPYSYHWPVKECDILIFDTGYADKDYVDRLANCLYEAKADIVRSVSYDFKLTVYHKE